MDYFGGMFHSLEESNIFEILKLAMSFSKMVDGLNAQLSRPARKEEVFQDLGLMGKDMSPCPDGWKNEIFIDFFGSTW